MSVMAWRVPGPIVLVLRLGTADAEWLGELAMRAGVRCLEVTLTQDDWRQSLEVLRNAHPDAVLGVGSIREAAEIAEAATCGASFAVSAIAVPWGAQIAHEAGLGWIEGAATPTEVEAAWRRGADIVKLFPARSLGGPSYLRALRGPLPEVATMPSGGVSPEEVGAWLDAGAKAVALGSSIATPDDLAQRRSDPVTARLEAAAAAARSR